MTELQNNDLVSKLGAASPVENVQANQVNLSDDKEKTASNQVILNEEPPQTVTIPKEESNGMIDSIENKTVNIPPTQAIDNTNINHITSNETNTSVANNILNDAVTPQSISTSLNATAHFGEQTQNNAIVSEIPKESGTINEIVDTKPQKILNIENTQSKTNSKAEYWKGFISGILISICLFATGAILYDHGSLVVSASNAIKLTDNNTTNEIVKMEDAVAFGDSLSNNYINNLLGKEKNENVLNEISVDDTNTKIQSGEDVIDDEDLDENNIDIIDDDVDDEDEAQDEISDEDSDENSIDTIDDDVDDEDEAQDDGKLVTKNNNLNKDKEEDSSSNNTQKSNTTSKDKMAGSIVSIFDDNNKENVENKDDSSDKTSPISYKYVDNVEDANRVISANCDNPHCGDISEANLEELVLCTEFRQSDRLDDGANRIGSNGICRYKDSSELVYIELD